MNLDLVNYLPELNFLTQEGRWQLLQQWIEDHPEYAERLDKWIDLNPDSVFPEIREIAAQTAVKQYGALAGALIRTTQLTPELSTWINTLLTCYRDRKEEGKEKHVGSNRKKK